LVFFILNQRDELIEKIVNLGTPDEANPQKVIEFLASFLSDQRAIKMPRLLWQAILHGMIMQVRPKNL